MEVLHEHAAGSDVSMPLVGDRSDYCRSIGQERHLKAATRFSDWTCWLQDSDRADYATAGF